MRKVVGFVLLLLGLLATTNCGSIPYRPTYTNHIPSETNPKLTIPIYIDKTFSSQDKLSIDNAINQWNYVLNGQMSLRVASYDFDMEPNILLEAQYKRAFLILKVDSDNYAIPDDIYYKRCAKIKGCTHTLAWCDRVGGSVMKLIRDRMDPEDVQPVLLHEIAHLLSVSHTKNKRSLMFPEYSKTGYLCVDYDTAKQVAATYDLNIERMNYCTHKE